MSNRSKWLRAIFKGGLVPPRKELTDASVYPPVIYGPGGQPTSEWARRQAAENIKNDPALKAKIENMVGMDEARRRYPEAYQDRETRIEPPVEGDSK